VDVVHLRLEIGRAEKRDDRRATTQGQTG
jgi:hypothetical protein